MNKCGLFVLLFVVSCIGLSGVFSSNASAASVYDNLVKVIPEVIVNDGTGNDPQDYTVNWYTEGEQALINKCADVGGTGVWCDAVIDWQNMLDVEGNAWSVSVGGNLGQYLVVSYTTTPGLNNSYFGMSFGLPSLIFEDTHNITFQYVDGSPVSSPAGLFAAFIDTNDGVYTEQTAANAGIFLSTFNLTYPVDYEGDIIPDTYTPPIVFEPELSANYSWSDKSIIFEDTTNYDEMPDLCWVQMPNNQYGDNFTEYYYDCNEQEKVAHTIQAKEYQTYIIIQFAMKDDILVSKNYSIDIDGRSGDSEVGVFSASNFFNQCIDNNAPFIHVEDCQNAFGVIGKTLSFGKINPLSDIRFEQLTECRQLNTLGSWINYENKLVCPAFNSTVRNVVTPFVAFGLSLTALGFVINRTARDFQ